jgi:DNA-binding NtrC family response regulator
MKKNYLVESNIPLPQQGKFTQHDFPFDRMTVGDSFVFDDEDFYKFDSALAKYQSTNPDYTFIIKRINHKQHRAWRSENKSDKRATVPATGTMNTVYKQLIFDTLARNQNNKRISAQELGISERTLYRKLKLYKVTNI